MATRKISDISLGTILILTGAFMLAFSSAIASYINVVLGVILFLIGGFMSFGFFSRKKYQNSKDYTFVIALFLASAGVFSIATPERSTIIVGVLWGLMSVSKGVFGINSQIGRKVNGEKILIPLLSSVIELVMGLILLIELSQEAISHHVILLSLTLMADGLGMMTSSHD